jgi:hypothetical protein
MMSLSSMNVVQQDYLAALKIDQTQGVPDSLQRIGAGREFRYPDFLQIAPATDYVPCF